MTNCRYVLFITITHSMRIYSKIFVKGGKTIAGAALFAGITLATGLLIAPVTNGQVTWLEELAGMESEVSDQELSSYADAALEIQNLQQETQRTMWRTVLNTGMALQTYHQIEQAVREDDHEVLSEMGEETGRDYDRITDTLETFIHDLEEKIALAIEQAGLKVDRFREISRQVHEDESLGQAAREKMRAKREAERQRVTRQARDRGEPEPGGTGEAPEPDVAGEVPGEEPALPIAQINSAESPEPDRESPVPDRLTPDYPEYVYHFVIRGNTLWELAERYYGDPYLWREIHNTNSDRLINPRRMRIGTVVRIPAAMMTEKPEPRLEVAQKREIVRDMFPFDRFRSRSFSYITQQQELRSELEVFTTVREIQDQIAKQEELRARLHDPPDFLTVLIPAEEVPEQIEEGDPELIMENMVTNDTRTPFGQDFYDRFRGSLVFPEETGGFMVRVIERPVPGRGSQMVVEVNYETVYMFRLPPDHERVMELAEAAAGGLRNYLANFEQFSQEYY